MDDAAQRLEQAVACYRARRDRAEHPKGEFSGPRNDRAWKIDPSERQPCCASAKPSDLGGRQKFIGHWLNQHCRSIEHVASLFGVAPDDLRSALKAKLMKDGCSEATADKKMKPGYPDQLIGALLIAEIITPAGNGWVVSNEVQASAMLMSKA